MSCFKIIKMGLNHANFNTGVICGYLSPSSKSVIGMSGSPSSYRDRVYIIKDVILKLVEYGELNQTALISFCGLNLKKHKAILDDLEENEMIERREQAIGKRTVTFYRATQRGLAFCRDILEPYEKAFPRRKNEKKPTASETTTKDLMLLLLI